MNDTPRTDAVEKHAYQFKDEWTPVCESKFVRKIERELNTANSEVERLTKKVTALYEGAEEQRQEIKSLRNQIDRMIGWKNEKDRQLCNLLEICRSNGIEVSSQDLINGRDEA